MELLTIVFTLMLLRKKGVDTKLTKRKKFLCIVFICYLIIVFGQTLLNRESNYFNNLNLHLFSAYKEAWYHFSMTEWRNIILNILMFVPFGLLLPLAFKQFDRFWKVYIKGLFFSIVIEIFQFITSRGIVEVDDILNNTIGTMIGYGFYILIRWINNKVKNQKKERLSICIVYQIPLIIMIFVFLGIFITYYEKEFGNLPEHYIYKQNMNNIDIYSKIDFEPKEKIISIYKTNIAGKAETQEFANVLFQKRGTKIDFSQNLFYENTAVFRDENNKFSLWVDYNGMTIWFTDFSQKDSNVNTDYNEIEVMEILSQYGITVPEGSRFDIDEEDDFIIKADMIVTGNLLYNGILTCKITKDKVLKECNNKIVTYQLYGEKKCISQQEAFENIQAGEFKLPSEEHLETLSIEKVILDYRVDTKGFYQPVYLFETKELIEPIAIPALN